MGETEISWTHKPGTVGRTWNPVQGCLRVSEGCRNCYAERLAARFAESGWSNGLINLKTRKWNGEARLAAHKLSEPLSWRKPSTVFVNSMSDLFYEGFTNEQIAAVFGVMAASPQHTFQVLTKRAKRMREWFEWLETQRTPLITIPWSPRLTCRAEAGKRLDVRGYHPMLGTEPNPQLWPLPNVWLGVSVENQAAADERIPDLLRTPAAVRFLSCEPLIGEVNLDRPRCEDPHHDDDNGWCVADDGATPYCVECDSERSYGHWLHLDGGINWVIAGCESGPRARPCSVEWLRSLRDQCADAGVPFFCKQAVDSMKNELCDDCGEPIRAYVCAPKRAAYSCGCTPEGGEDGAAPFVAAGEGSKRKAGGVIELPYLDGVQWAQFPGGE